MRYRNISNIQMQHYSLLLLLMDFKQLENQFIQELNALYDREESKQLYYMVTAHLCGWSRSELLIHQNEYVSEELFSNFDRIRKELIMGKPVQHIFSEAWFYGLKFKVSSSVLIPRPETEELVEWILQTIDGQQGKALSLLDIGTGSGCIAIALKKLRAEIGVEALDISADALNVAKQNAISNEVSINFIEADICQYESGLKYDLIISNPPYITEDERKEMHQNVLQYEPHLALFVTNENPLIFYKSIADFAKINLNPSGKLFIEINEYLGKEMIEMLVDKGFTDIVLKKDMQGKDRMICCTI